MTIAARSEPRETGVSPYLPALLSAREPLSDGLLEWPEGLRCDLIAAPLDVCCGVITHLAAAGTEVCPIAQIGDRLLFLVAEDSHAACSEAMEELPDGVVVSGHVERFPDRYNTADAVSRCWVIPTDCAGPVLPPARAVLAALRSAYAEYQLAKKTKIV